MEEKTIKCDEMSPLKLKIIWHLVPPGITMCEVEIFTYEEFLPAVYPESLNLT